MLAQILREILPTDLIKQVCKQKFVYNRVNVLAISFVADVSCRLEAGNHPLL